MVVRVVFIWAFLCFGFLRQGLPCSPSWPRTCGFRSYKASLQSWAVLPQPLELWDIGLSHYVWILLFWDLKKNCVCVWCVSRVCHVSTESRRGPRVPEGGVRSCSKVSDMGSRNPTQELSKSCEYSWPVSYLNSLSFPPWWFISLCVYVYVCHTHVSFDGSSCEQLKVTTRTQAPVFWKSPKLLSWALRVSIGDRVLI